MSGFNSRYSSISYANVAAGTLQRTSSTDTPLDQTPNVATYAQAPYIPASQARISRQGSFESSRVLVDTQTGTWQHGTQKSDDDMTLYQDRSPTFFTPTYLAGSRYIDRLRQEIEEQEEYDAHERSEMQQSSSPVSYMHRGVAQNVIERPPHHDYDGKPRMLPSAWNEYDKATGLEVLGDGSEIRFAGVHKKIQDEAASIRTDHPIPREVGIYYFEVSILSRGKDALIGVGFSSRKTPLTRLPGWEAESYAYHGDDGDVYSGSSNGRQYGPKFSSADIIGCGINFKSNKIFFTKNGILLGTAFTDLKPGTNLYPSIGIKKAGEHIRANFGKSPFVFDIDSIMQHAVRDAKNVISRQDVEKLHPPDSEGILVQRLVAQYLAHEGYIETSRAFLKDLREQRRLAPSTASQMLPDDNSAESDIHSVNRQRIRQAILHGDINRALKLTQSCYPHLLQQERNWDTYFRLRCRRFIEVIRRYSDLAKATSGLHEIDHNAHQKDTQMELDDQIQRETIGALEDTEMDGMADPISSMKQHDLLTAAIEYGQGLKTEFESDARPDHKRDLGEIFALMAYEDPRSSPVGHLLDKSGRASIAEELNAAILVSLGQPSSAALEKLCSHTEALLDETAGKFGGAAAFVNLKNIMQC